MTKENVLALLLRAEEPISGEQMSRTLGVSRAAVWKAMDALRQDGYEIEAAPRRGYRLRAWPAEPDLTRIRALLCGAPWADRVQVLERTDSTNNEVKRLAAAGAPSGTCVIARVQTGGRGRMGRTFLSPEGGLYMSVLLRPRVQPEQLLPVTALTAVAAMRAVERVSGLRPGIKWTNDLVADGKKLCGILTELSMEAQASTVDYVVIGIGVNCARMELPPELRQSVTDLETLTGRRADCSRLAAEMLTELSGLEDALREDKAAWLREFSENCVTIGRAVSVVRGGAPRHARAEGIDENAALLVTYDDGSTEAVSSGEVSVRGMYGYV